MNQQAIVEKGRVRNATAQEVDNYLHKGFLNRVGQIGPYAAMGLMGYGALTGGTGSLAALGSGGTAASGLDADIASTLAVPGTQGAGMKFGLGSLAKFFNSPGGTAAVNAGTNLAGGAMQAHAQGQAANTQARYAEQALAFAKQQYADAIKNFAPYMQASQGATAKLTDFLNQSRPPSMGAPTSGTPGMNLGAMAPGGGQLVTLKAPTGQIKQVPAEQAQHYLDLGAQPVQG